jgi:hypothetical protein
VTGIKAGSIVRVNGRSGDYLVVSVGLELGTHVPTVYLQALSDKWVSHRTERTANCYLSPQIDLD